MNYEELWKLNVLELKDSLTGNQETVYEEFKEQLTGSPKEWERVSVGGTSPW